MISEVNSLGLTLKYETPDTADEFDTLAGRVGACLSEAVSNVLYRNTLTSFRNAFCEKLAEDTEIQRNTKVTGQKKNADGEMEDVEGWAESELEFVKRVCAEKNVEVSAFQHIADAIISSDDGRFDPTRQERKSAGPKKPAKTYVKLAEKVLEVGRGDVLAADLSAKLGIPVDGSDVTSIARAIAENEKRKRASLEDEYVA